MSIAGGDTSNARKGGAKKDVATRYIKRKYGRQKTRKTGVAARRTSTRNHPMYSRIRNLKTIIQKLQKVVRKAAATSTQAASFFIFEYLGVCSAVKPFGVRKIKSKIRTKNKDSKKATKKLGGVIEKEDNSKAEKQKKRGA